MYHPNIHPPQDTLLITPYHLRRQFRRQYNSLTECTSQINIQYLMSPLKLISALLPIPGFAGEFNTAGDIKFSAILEILSLKSANWKQDSSRAFQILVTQLLADLRVLLQGADKKTSCQPRQTTQKQQEKSKEMLVLFRQMLSQLGDSLKTQASLSSLRLFILKQVQSHSTVVNQYLEEGELGNSHWEPLVLQLAEFVTKVENLKYQDQAVAILSWLVQKKNYLRLAVADKTSVLSYLVRVLGHPRISKFYGKKCVRFIYQLTFDKPHLLDLLHSIDIQACFVSLLQTHPFQGLETNMEKQLIETLTREGQLQVCQKIESLKQVLLYAQLDTQNTKNLMLNFLLYATVNLTAHMVFDAGTPELLEIVMSRFNVEDCEAAQGKKGAQIIAICVKLMEMACLECQDAEEAENILNKHFVIANYIFSLKQVYSFVVGQSARSLIRLIKNPRFKKSLMSKCKDAKLDDKLITHCKGESTLAQFKTTIALNELLFLLKYDNSRQKSAFQTSKHAAPGEQTSANNTKEYVFQNRPIKDTSDKLALVLQLTEYVESGSTPSKKMIEQVLGFLTTEQTVMISLNAEEEQRRLVEEELSRRVVILLEKLLKDDSEMLKSSPSFRQRILAYLRSCSKHNQIRDGLKFILKAIQSQSPQTEKQLFTKEDLKEIAVMAKRRIDKYSQVGEEGSIMNVFNQMMAKAGISAEEINALAEPEQQSRSVFQQKKNKQEQKVETQKLIEKQQLVKEVELDSRIQSQDVSEGKQHIKTKQVQIKVEGPKSYPKEQLFAFILDPKTAPITIQQSVSLLSQFVSQSQKLPASVTKTLFISYANSNSQQVDETTKTCFEQQLLSLFSKIYIQPNQQFYHLISNKPETFSLCLRTTSGLDKTYALILANGLKDPKTCVLSARTISKNLIKKTDYVAMAEAEIPSILNYIFASMDTPQQLWTLGELIAKSSCKHRPIQMSYTLCPDICQKLVKHPQLPAKTKSELLHALAQLISQHPKNEDIVVSDLIYPVVLACVAQSKQGQLIEKASYLISKICLTDISSAKSRKVVLKYNTVEILVKTLLYELQQTVLNVQVARHILKALSNCCLMIENSVIILDLNFTKGFKKIASDALLEKQSSLSLVKPAVEVLINLASHVEQRAKNNILKLVDHGCLKIIIDLLLKYPVNGQLGCCCLQVLVAMAPVSTVADKMVDLNIYEALAQIMRLQETNPKILKLTLRLFQLILENNHKNVEKVMQNNHKIVKMIPEIIRNLSSNDEPDKDMQASVFQILNKLYDTRLTNKYLCSGLTESLATALRFKHTSDEDMNHLTKMCFGCLVEGQSSETLNRLMFEPLIKRMHEQCLHNEQLVNTGLNILHIIQINIHIEASSCRSLVEFSYYFLTKAKEICYKSYEIKVRQYLCLLAVFMTRSNSLKIELDQNMFKDILSNWIKIGGLLDIEGMREAVALCVLTLENKAKLPPTVEGVNLAEAALSLDKGMDCLLYRRDKSRKNGKVAVRDGFLVAYKAPDGEIKQKYRMPLDRILTAVLSYKQNERLMEWSVFNEAGGVFVKSPILSNCLSLIGYDNRIPKFFDLEFKNTSDKDRFIKMFMLLQRNYLENVCMPHTSRP